MYTIIAACTLLYHAYTYVDPSVMALQATLRAEALLNRFGRQLSNIDSFAGESWTDSPSQVCHITPSIPLHLLV
jgi:hypothetical protein